MLNTYNFFNGNRHMYITMLPYDGRGIHAHMKHSSKRRPSMMLLLGLLVNLSSRQTNQCQSCRRVVTHFVSGTLRSCSLLAYISTLAHVDYIMVNWSFIIDSTRLNEAPAGAREEVEGGVNSVEHSYQFGLNRSTDIAFVALLHTTAAICYLLSTSIADAGPWHLFGRRG